VISILLLFLCSCRSLNSNFRVNCLCVVLCCICPAFSCPAFSRNPVCRIFGLKNKTQNATLILHSAVEVSALVLRKHGYFLLTQTSRSYGGPSCEADPVASLVPWSRKRVHVDYGYDMEHCLQSEKTRAIAFFLESVKWPDFYREYCVARLIMTGDVTLSH